MIISNFEFRNSNFNKAKIFRLLIFVISFYLIWVIPAVIKEGCQVFAKTNDEYVKPQWKYIVIHHSATKVGNAAMFAKYHSSKRHMQNGLAYHFVIDNGTCGKMDGQLEIGDRWKKQLPGGHCKQDWVNQSGIGICLVGNFNYGRPSLRQMRTLVNLINKLREKYNIPIENVLGHGKIKGEKSQCPGKYFPFRDLYSQLKADK